jgi:iron complex transport system substrate-binding protein
MNVRALIALIGWSLGLLIGVMGSVPVAYADFPMSFENKGRLVTVKKAPQKVLTFGVPAAEIMAALDLGPVVMGRIHNREGLWPEYEAALKAVPKIAGPDQITQEIVQGADFFFGSFPPSAQELSWDWLPVYVLEPGSFEDLYQRIRDIGQIFEVEERAETVLAKLNDQLYQTTRRVQNYEPVKTIVYDPRADGLYVCGGTDFESRLVSLAGGVNVFADRPEWSKVTAAEILDREPEAIVLVQYGDKAPELKTADLKADPILSKLMAVTNNKILVLDLEALESGLRAGLTVAVLAKFFHPSLF